MTQYRSHTQSSTEEESRVQLSKWVDAADGKYKGRVYGAGVLSACYKEGPSHLDANTSSNGNTSSDASTGRSHTDDLARRVAAAEREAHEAKRGQQELQSKIDQMAEQQSQMQRQLLALLQQQSRPPPHHQQYYYGPPPTAILSVPGTATDTAVLPAPAAYASTTYGPAAAAARPAGHRNR